MAFDRHNDECRQGFHTATLLPNGLVLVAGGVGADGLPVAVAELYDPALSSWNPTGAMALGRFSHTATLLPDGRVLVAGGVGRLADIFASTRTAELYDPTTGTWSPTASMDVIRDSHTATLLPTGRVLVAGGTTNVFPFTATAAAELYDPNLGTWSATGAMSVGRFLHTVTLLPSGKVLAAGGLREYNAALAAAELYDPSSGTWASTGSMAAARAGHTATLLIDRKTARVVVAGGGRDSLDGFQTVELYTAPKR